MPIISDSWVPADLSLRQAANVVLGNTLGIAWRAVTGTVDPWTKDGMIVDEKNALIQASAGQMPEQEAEAQATADVTGTLILNNADPSQAGPGNNPGLEELLHLLKIFGWVAVGAAVLYGLGQISAIAKVVKE